MLCVKNGMIHDGIHPEAFRGIFWWRMERSRQSEKI